MRGMGDFGAGLMADLPPIGAEVKIDDSRKSAKISFNPMENAFDVMSRSQGTQLNMNVHRIRIYVSYSMWQSALAFGACGIAYYITHEGTSAE